MARYRPVFTGLWVCDDKFQDYSVPGKLLFLYLITNDHLNESGIYKITYKTISNETGLTIDRVKKLIHGQVDNNVSYDGRQSVIFVHKFLKFNGAGNPDLIKKSINKDKRLIKTTLWKEFDKYYTRDLQPIENSFESNPSNSNTNSNTNNNSKKTYGQDELDRLFEKFWERYPNTADKAQAKVKWLTNIVTNGINPQILEDALTGYINCLNSNQTPVRYIKHGKTFLYQGNKKKKISPTWEQFLKYADPKYKVKPRL